jgi:peptidoglycan/LPS O-acetylase OafA/YrhL
MHTQSLTPLRFIAAFIVVIFHFGGNTEFAQLAPNILTAGSQMVSFFFVLSGFVMVQAYARKEALPRGQYWLSRIARIAPVYFLALLLAGLFITKPALNNGFSLALNLTFLQAWIPPYPLSFNGPSWSLSVEMFLYLLFPFILNALKGSRLSSTALVMSALLFWIGCQMILGALLSSSFYQGFPSASFDLIHFFPLTHLSSFLLGITGGFLALKNDKTYPMLHSLVFILGSFLLVMAALHYRPLYASQTGFSAPLHGSFYAPFFLLVIIAVATSAPNLTRPLRAKPLLLLGEISYGFYILQAPIHHLYMEYVATNLDLGYEANFYGYIVVLLTTSMTSYYLLEIPIKRWAKHRVGRNSA